MAKRLALLAPALSLAGLSSAQLLTNVVGIGQVAVFDDLYAAPYVGNIVYATGFFDVRGKWLNSPVVDSGSFSGVPIPKVDGVTSAYEYASASQSLVDGTQSAVYRSHIVGSTGLVTSVESQGDWLAVGGSARAISDTYLAFTLRAETTVTFDGTIFSQDLTGFEILGLGGAYGLGFEENEPNGHFGAIAVIPAGSYTLEAEADVSNGFLDGLGGTIYSPGTSVCDVSFTATFTAAPEPAPILALLGSCGLLARRRRAM